MDAYQVFLASKAIRDPATGLQTFSELPDAMFSFQRDITSWALRRGRAALFEGTGLGKSFQELAWADAVHRETGRDILHLAPLAVTSQMVREADKFGIVARQVRNQAGCLSGNNITNFQKLDHFDLSKFGGVILDESSILKSTDGHYRTKLIAECQQIPFRLAATATPAPNDFMELGNHAEFLGVMSYTDMLATFFTHDGGDTQKWMLKGHAENDFWAWMASWAVMLRKPSDLGYSDEGYDLPPLRLHQHTVESDTPPEGFLFSMPAQTLAERIKARRDTVDARIEKAASLVLADWNDKLATCLGNLNTQKHAAINMPATPPSESAEKLNPERPRKIAHTCAPTSPDTPKNSENLLTSETGECDPNTGLAFKTTKNCSPPKAASVQSVRCQAGTNGETASTSTTATPAKRLEDYCAATATGGLVNLETIPNDCLEPWLIWCNLNSEQDALARIFGKRCFSVSGSDGEDEKEAAILGWINGERPVMLSKPRIMGFGLNFQFCHKTVFVGLNDSWEQYYQAVRRFWRFGQTHVVDAHLIAADTEGNVVSNLQRKERDAERMLDAMVRHTKDLSTLAVRGQVRDTPDYNPTKKMELPTWA